MLCVDPCCNDGHCRVYLSLRIYPLLEIGGLLPLLLILAELQPLELLLLHLFKLTLKQFLLSPLFLSLVIWF